MYAHPADGCFQHKNQTEGKIICLAYQLSKTLASLLNFSIHVTSAVSGHGLHGEENRGLATPRPVGAYTVGMDKATQGLAYLLKRKEYHTPKRKSTTAHESPLPTKNSSTVTTSRSTQTAHLMISLRVLCI